MPRLFLPNSLPSSLSFHRFWGIYVRPPSRSAGSPSLLLLLPPSCFTGSSPSHCPEHLIPPKCFSMAHTTQPEWEPTPKGPVHSGPGRQGPQPSLRGSTSQPEPAPGALCRPRGVSLATGLSSPKALEAHECFFHFIHIQDATGGDFSPPGDTRHSLELFLTIMLWRQWERVLLAPRRSREGTLLNVP